MQVDVFSQIRIMRPRSVVAAFAIDPDKVPLWYENIKSVAWRTPPPLRVGSQIDFIAKFLGRRLAYTYEVVTLVPDELFVMQTSQGPFPMETSYKWQSATDVSTLMTLRNRGTPTGFGRLVAPFLSFAMRRATGKDLARLKNILESGAGPKA